MTDGVLKANATAAQSATAPHSASLTWKELLMVAQTRRVKMMASLLMVQCLVPELWTALGTERIGLKATRLTLCLMEASKEALMEPVKGNLKRWLEPPTAMKGTRLESWR